MTRTDGRAGIDDGESLTLLLPLQVLRQSHRMSEELPP
jgi:hypothetical protein